MSRNYFSKITQLFFVYSGIPRKNFIWFLAVLLIGFCLFEIIKPVYIDNSKSNIFLLIPFAVGSPGIFYSSSAKNIIVTTIVTPLDIGPTFLSLHFILASLVGWSLFRSSKAKIKSEEFQAIPIKTVPNELLTFCALFIALYSFGAWGIYDLSCVVLNRNSTIWGTHLFSVDPKYLGISPFENYLPFYYLLKWIIFCFLITVQSYLIILCLSRYSLKLVLPILCVYSVFRNAIYTFMHNNFTVLLRDWDGEKLSFLYTELKIDAMIWGFEICLFLSVLMIVNGIRSNRT